MKKFIVIFVFGIFAVSAWAVNDNAATSKTYVDTAMGSKQPTVPNEGNNVVMTFDSTADDGIGTKQIYDSTGNYATQQESLVTAVTANAAIQLMLDGELTCHMYNPDDATDCWLWNLRETTNLLKTPISLNKATFDSTTAILSNTWNADKNYVDFMIITGDTGISYGQNYRIIARETPFRENQTYKTTFTTSASEHYLHLKHNDRTDDIRVTFEIEPSTTYTIIAKALESNPSVVGGMKLQLMLVRGEYQYDDILPYGENIFMPRGE